MAKSKSKGAESKPNVLILGYCLQCGNTLEGNVLELISCDPEDLTSRFSRCDKCSNNQKLFLRVPNIPRYQCHYLSTTGNETEAPFELQSEKIHFYTTTEAYELFFPNAWNGFKQVCKPDDIPPLYEVSVPSMHSRQSFIVDAVLLITSFVAGGIIGGASYDLLKQQARKIWESIPEKYKKKTQSLIKEAPVQVGNEFDKVFESSFIYLNRRLAGLNALSAPNGILFKIACYFAQRVSVSSRELAEHLGISLEETKTMLKFLGARYSLSTKKWQLPPDIQSYYAEKKEIIPTSHDIETPFFVQDGFTREVAWDCAIPTPPGLSEEEEMDFECDVFQATTPDTEAFLRGEISQQELQQRMYLKAATLATDLLKKKT